MKFIVFTTDVPPVDGVPTSGTALRTFGLAQGLKALGHQVEVSVPKSALDGFRKTALGSIELQEKLKEFETNAFDARNQADLIENSGADVAICGHWPALTTSFKPDIPVVLDLAGPHLLERHYQGSPNQDGAILGKINAMSRADYFIVSGAKQRLYFLSYLLRAKVPSPEKRICTIPMPLPPQTPVHDSSSNAETYPNFVFGGVFLPWQNPSHSLRFVAKELQERNLGKLTCIGGQHPNYPIKEGIYQQLFDELSQNPRVDVKPMAPYENFISLLGSQDVAVDLMKWNLERELAVTIRSTTYLWAGVPVIYNSYADLGGLIAEYDAGWLVEPEDSQGLKQVCQEIYDNPDIVRRKSEAAQRLARECFSWDKVVQPLLSLIDAPTSETTDEVDITLDFPQNASLRITPQSPVAQQFTCRVDGLSKVEFRIATHGSSNPTPFEAKLVRKEGSQIGQDAISSQKFSGGDISNNDWHCLEFNALAHSAGCEFILQLNSCGDQVGADDDAVSPWACNDSPYPLTSLTHGTSVLKGKALCVRTTCQTN